MEKKSITKIIVSVIMLIILMVLQSMLLPSLISSSFINKNTASYMIFDIEMDGAWNKHSEYTWIDQDTSYKDFINQEWSTGIGDIFLEGYTSDYYVAAISELIATQTKTSVDDMYDCFENSEFSYYTNEFIKMQAGYLVGDNIPPTPNTQKLQESLDLTMSKITDENITTWYAEHNLEIVGSLKDAMVNSNELFSSDMLEKNPIFAESCLILKILNLLLLFYSTLALSIILIFCLIKVCKNKYTWTMLATSQLVAALATISTYFSLKNINFVVFGIPYSPTYEMIHDCWPIFVVLLACEIILGALFILIKIFGKKMVPRVISKKKS